MVIIGSAAEQEKILIDMLRKQGVRAGLLKIRLFRPFPAEEIAEALKNVKYLAIMDRTEDYNGHCGPLVQKSNLLFTMQTFTQLH